MLQMELISPQKIIAKDVPVPTAAKGQVVIKVLRTGICGSDVHAYYNKHPFITLPIVPGHEFAGIITEIGEGVSDFSVGDRVTAMPQIFCGKCRNCKTGRYHICVNLKVIGCQAPGSAREKMAIDANLVLKLPDDINIDQGTMLEPITVGIHACRRAGDVKGKRVVVLGAGTIGNVTAQAAKALGAESVMITDLVPFRLETAKKCGIDYTVNIAETDLLAEMNRVWDADGADIYIECVGVGATVNQAIEAARKGCDIVIAGVFDSMATINMGMVQDKELALIGTLMYIKEDWLDAIKFVQSGAVKLEPLMSVHFPLSKMAEAFKYVENNKDTAMKVLVES
jgi:L-iditol 2-dehydrogenase